jgi:C1A family cysteine protease
MNSPLTHLLSSSILLTFSSLIITPSSALFILPSFSSDHSSSLLLHNQQFYENKFSLWFAEFKDQIEKVQNENHFFHMFQNFAHNDDLIERHNIQNLSYTLGHNAFSHMSFEEWSGEYMKFGLIKREHVASDFIHEAPLSSSSNPNSSTTLPTSIDWVRAGAVTPVKNQGNCGSCWAFSATGAVEGVYQLHTHILKSFSEQELVSCNTSPFTNHGCQGGLMDYAFKWVKSNGGLCLETAYPYTSGLTGQNGDCVSHSFCDDTSVKLTGYVDVRTSSDSALASAVALNPVSVAIEANQPAFQLYKSGVLTSACGTSLDHGVLCVGYGVDSTGGPYWKVKNSWGVSWGEGGYVRLARGESYNEGKGQCGIYSGPPSYPTM